MTFTVVAPRGRAGKVDGFYLVQDNWNDFGFQTQYHLYLVDGDDEAVRIGTVKILKKGQKGQDYLQLAIGTFPELGAEFCSVGQSLDYYERLAELGVDRRDFVLKGLRDIVQAPDLVAEFENEEGWKTSLFRDFSPDAEFFATAKALIDQNYEKLASEDLEFSFHPRGWQEPIKLDFGAPRTHLDETSFFDEDDSAVLPSRIIVLVGRNGSGKSTLLARLARIMHASPSDRRRRQLREIGEIIPNGIGFTRVVAISYSAFDSFLPPGIDNEERRQVALDISTGRGRYMFCGLRDMPQELADIVDAGADGGQPEPERLPINRIKSLDALTAEFDQAISKIKASKRMRLLRQCTRPLLLEPSLYSGPGVIIDEFLGDAPADKFASLSTGHKIVLHAIASIISHIQHKSVVLFDEPETHLHPPLLAAFMRGIRVALRELESFAIVATHSPVVVQETLAQHVRKVVRDGDGGRIRPPGIETFGEGIGTITNDVFALDPETTAFHPALKKLAELSATLAEVEAAFPEGLSMQARGYVMSVIAAKAKKAEGHTGVDTR
jgi:predicted ATPase